MKRILFAAAVMALGLATGRADAQGFKPDPNYNYKVLAFRAVESGKLEGVVASIDPAGRQIGIKGASGKVRTVKAGKNIQGLEKINVEDSIIAEYYRSATFFVDKPGTAPMAPEAVSTFVSASKTNEVVEAGEVAAEGTATISAIDKGAGTVTFTGPGGRTFPVKVENPTLLDGVKVGQPPPPPPPPPAPKHAKIEGKKILIDDVIYFDTNKDTIQSRSNAILDDVAQVMTGDPKINVRVEGHACKDPASAKRGKAGAEYNLKLSDKRAKAVKAYLVGKGIDAKRLDGVGFGWNQPIAPNDTKAGRAKNQRVDFVITN